MDVGFTGVYTPTAAALLASTPARRGPGVDVDRTGCRKIATADSHASRIPCRRHGGSIFDMDHAARAAEPAANPGAIGSARGHNDCIAVDQDRAAATMVAAADPGTA